MSGFQYVLILLLSAALPLFLAVFWMFRRRRSFFPLPFLSALLAGMLSIIPALLLQQLFVNYSGNTLLYLFFRVFIGIALTEEASRLLVLGGLKRIALKKESSGAVSSLFFGPFSGLTAGLGLAMLETASYALHDPGIALLRAFSAAPLHGACGIRVGLAVSVWKDDPGRAVLLFLSAVALHGMYNLLILVPVFSSYLPVALAFIALASVLGSLRSNT